MDQVSKFMLKVITNILRPFVKLMIAHGVTFPMISEILKRVYVDVTISDYKLDPNKKITDSRITLLTKVHRKDVRRIRAEKEDIDLPEEYSSLGAQIVAKWFASDQYTDDNGKPKALMKLASKAKGEANFEALVSSLNNDIRPRAALDEMISQKMISEDSDGLIRLNEEAFIPRENFEELMGHFNRNIHDHLSAAVHNVVDERKPFMERSVYYNGLSNASIEKLEKLVEKHGMEALVALNKAAYDYSKNNQDQNDDKNRMTFGIYFYSEKDEN